MSYLQYIDMTEQQRECEIENIEQKIDELTQRIIDMKVASLVNKSPFKPGDIVVDRQGRRGIVEVLATDSTFLRSRMFNPDGTKRALRATIYTPSEWELIEKSVNRE